MIKHLAVAVCLLFCPLFANAQAQGGYITTYNRGVTDLTNYATSGTNIWKLLGGGGVCTQIYPSYDGKLWCVNASHNVYKFNVASQSWQLQTAMGSNIQALIVHDDNNIYSLQSTGCTGYGYQLFKWTSTTWVPQNGCLNQGEIGFDWAFAGVQNSILYYTTNPANGWTWLGTGYSYAALTDQYTICGVKGGQLYRLASGAMSLMSPQPSGTLAGCAYTRGDSPSFFVWTTSGAVSILDLSAGTAWKPVSGLTVSSLVASNKSRVFALTSTGQPYHWNVYAGYIQGNITGSLRGCPAPGDPCPPGITHTASIQVKFPHSLNGNLAKQAGSPETNLNVSSWDSNLVCDPLMDPNDPECEPTASVDEVICSLTGVNMTSGTPPAETESYDVVKWSGDFYPGPIVGPNSLGLWLQLSGCGVSHAGTCQYGQVAVCQIDGIDSLGYGNTPSEAQTMSLNGCETSGPWGQLFLYTPDVAGSCRTIGLPDDNVPIPAVCF